MSRSETPADGLIIVAYANLPGGYSWITSDGSMPPEQVASAMIGGIEQSFKERQDFVISRKLANGSWLEAKIVYDALAADEMDRKGLVLGLGLNSAPGLPPSNPAPLEIMDRLGRKRDRIMQAGITAEEALLAMRQELGDLRSLLFKPVPVPATVPPAAQPVPLRELHWPRRVILFLWVQTVCLVLITLLLALQLVSSGAGTGITGGNGADSKNLWDMQARRLRNR
jgi:hypothetical protein